MDSQQCRKFGAASVVVQGVVTALFPRLSVKFIKRMIGKNFENAETLEAKPAYRRQLRALGVGMAAAGAANLLLDRAEETTGTRDEETTGTRDEETTGTRDEETTGTRDEETTGTRDEETTGDADAQ